MEQGPSGRTAVTFPSRAPCAMEELFDGGGVRAENGVCRLALERGVAKLYLLGGAGFEPWIAS